MGRKEAQKTQKGLFFFCVLQKKRIHHRGHEEHEERRKEIKLVPFLRGLCVLCGEMSLMREPCVAGSSYLTNRSYCLVNAA